MQIDHYGSQLQSEQHFVLDHASLPRCLPASTRHIRRLCPIGHVVYRTRPYSLFMTHATRKNVGQRVRALREERNLTQEQLALMTGVGRSYLAKVEAGNRNATIDFMEKVALGLGVTLGQLFEGL